LPEPNPRELIDSNLKQIKVEDLYACAAVQDPCHHHQVEFAVREHVISWQLLQAGWIDEKAELARKKSGQVYDAKKKTTEEV